MQHDAVGDMPGFKILMNTMPLRHVSMIEFMYFRFTKKNGEDMEIETSRYGKAYFYTKALGQWMRLVRQLGVLTTKTI